MALINCKECGTEISDQADACVRCGAPAPKAWGASHDTAPPPIKEASFRWWLWLPLVGLAGFFMLGAIAPRSADDGARERAQSAIDLCRQDIANPVTPSSTKEALRSVCSRMQEDFRERYRREP